MKHLGSRDDVPEKPNPHGLTPISLMRCYQAEDSVSQSNQDNSKYFPRLNIDVLKVHAERWAKRWPDVPIDRIILYNYASELQKHSDDPIKYKKYAVVFEISIVDKLRVLTPKGQFRYDYAVASGIITPEPYYEFEKDIEYNTSIDQDKKYKALITEDFTNVYWEKPDDEFRREWVFIPRKLVYDKKEKKLFFEGLPVNVRLDEPHEILFQAEKFSKIDVPPEDIKDETPEKDPDDFLAKKEVSEKQYIFRPTGPAWHIRYDGNDLFGLKGKGFQCIYYLILNEGKVYHTNELEFEVQADEIEGDIQTISYRDREDKKAEKKQADHRDLINGRSLLEIKNEYYSLKQNLREAEEHKNPKDISEAENSLKEFSKYYYEYLQPNGSSRKYLDPVTRRKNKICKRIERSLNVIKKHDEQTWKHFNSSLRPINSYLHSYTPDRYIEWLTE